MTLIAKLEKIAYEPLSTYRQGLYNHSNSLKNNDAIREQLVQELSGDSNDISYDLYPCETALFMSEILELTVS